MAQVKLGLRDKPIPFIIEFSTNVVKVMTKNPNFLSPNPALSDISDLIAALGDAYTDALDGGKALKSIMNLAKKALLDKMASLATYVQNISQGDETIIRSSGMGVRKTKFSKDKPATAENLRTTENENAGEVSLKWKRVEKAKSYIIQMTNTPDVDTSWLPAGISTRSSITITGLTTGKNYWFRVAAIGAHGQGGWSEIAKKMIG
jgi:hypothetical protein